MSIPKLISQLQSPQAYPHAVHEISLRETHISWILLTGDYAYKIKKPVKYHFLDYSTLALRKSCCQQELLLNNRYSPELYLDVIPITGTVDNPQINGTGVAIEYAVKMRQFDENYLLINLVKQNQLTLSQVETLAEVVAKFHLNASSIPPGDHTHVESLLASIRKPAEDNLAYLMDIDELKAQVQFLQNWTSSTSLNLTPRFLQRVSEGNIRECHGDLHLGNVVVIDERICLFDGIEFNDTLRKIDTISDAAFMVMDLEDHEHLVEANRFLNHYLEQTGDYSGLGVLRWYLVYRALVRAKVAALRSEQHAGHEDFEEISQYVQLANNYSVPSKPTLLLTHGVSGSGKTTGTQQLVDQHGCIRIRSDVERKRLLGLQAMDSTSVRARGDAYSSSMTRVVYEHLAQLSQECLFAQYSVIVDATFLKRWQRDIFFSLADELKIPCYLIPFQASRSDLDERIRNRIKTQRDASEATIEVLNHQLLTQESLTPTERQKCYSIDEIQKILRTRQERDHD